MAKRKLEDYTFANAYIGSHVRNLMSWQDLVRLASCKDLPSAENVLQEFGYGEAKELYDDDIEWFIRKEQNKLFDLVYDTLPERKELALSLYPYDYHNVKVCLKSEFLGLTPSEDFLVSTGDIEWKRVVAMVRERNLTFMTANMRNAILEATDLFSRGGDPQEIDIIMDKACYKDMIEAAIEIDDDFLIGLVKLNIDLINLKTFARLRQIKKPWSFLQKVFLEGGNISEQFFIGCYEEPYAQVADKLAPYGLKEVMSEGGKQINDSGNFALLEKLCVNKMIDYCKQAKYITFGLAPIVGYWYAKESEIDNLRVILTGILIGSQPEEIIERLRQPYV